MSDALNETQHEHIMQSLAGKDINSKIEDGKVVVHKSNLAKAKIHVARLGHKMTVVSGLNESEELDEESLDEAQVDYKHNGTQLLKRVDKGQWKPHSKNIEFKKNGQETLHRVDKGTWNPLPTGHKYMNEETLEEGDHYHSVWVKPKGHTEWSHHFDADNKEDAADEKYSCKNNGDKCKVLKVHKSEADWRKPEHRAKAIAKLNESDDDEDYEQLDELSKKTLGSYVKKAKVDSDERLNNYHNGMDRARDFGSDTPRDKGISDEIAKNAMSQKDKSTSRKNSISKAVSKLTKESVEELDEANNWTHQVHVRDYSMEHDPESKQAIEAKKEHPHIEKHLKLNGGEYHGSTDKGYSFKFKSKTQAQNFHDAIKKNKWNSPDKPELHESVEELDEMVGKPITNKVSGKQGVVTGKSSGGGKVFVKYEDGTEREFDSKTLKQSHNIKEENEMNLEDYSAEEIQEYLESEEGQQLDEVSKATLGSYVEKAKTDKAKNFVKYTKSDTKEDRLKTSNDYDKRANGIKTAVAKLTKEETMMEAKLELIDLLMQDKTSEAMEKFEELAATASFEAMEAKRAELTHSMFNESEEGQQLDEVSGKLLGSYIQKARADIKQTVAHKKELDSHPKVKALQTKLSDYYSRREYTKSGDSKYRKQIDKTSSAMTDVKKKIDPDYPKSVSASKRFNGVEKAVKKLHYGKLSEELNLEDYSLEEIQEYMQTEEFEQLDELSKTTLGSYVRKAQDSSISHYLKAKAGADYIKNTLYTSNRDDDSPDRHTKDDIESVDRHKHWERKRDSGIEKAVSKLNK